jgi:hypothetical protein
MILSHTLIIEEDGSWEIDHLAECWFDVTDWDGGPALYRDTDCKISGKINWDPDAIDEFGTLPTGRYRLTYRHAGEGERYEDWLLVGCERASAHGPHELCPGSGVYRAARS